MKQGDSVWFCPHISGAGVLLLDAAHNDAAVLFKENNGKFADPGGKVDFPLSRSDPMSAVITASRELLEESLGLVWLPPEMIIKHSVVVDIRAGSSIYRFFLIRVSGLHVTDYNHNRDKVVFPNRGRLPSCWQETQGMTRLGISRAAIQTAPHSGKGDWATKDIFGNSITVRSRIVNLVIYRRAQLDRALSEAAKRAPLALKRLPFLSPGLLPPEMKTAITVAGE